MIRRVLDVGRDDMLSLRRQRGIIDRWDRELDPRLAGKAAVLRGIEGALDPIDVVGESDPPGQGTRLLIRVARRQPDEGWKPRYGVIHFRERPVRPDVL